MTAIPLSSKKMKKKDSSSKKERKRKRKEQDEDDAVTSEVNMEEKEEKDLEATPKHKKKDKKKKKKKHKDEKKKEKEETDIKMEEEEEEEEEEDNDNHSDKADPKINKEDAGDDDKITPEKSKGTTKEKRQTKKLEKQALLDKVPKTDKDGIAYTKLQIRRMMKRVKRGLDPVETPQEEQERKRLRNLEQKEEEAQLAGMLFQKNKREDNEDDDNNNNDEHGDDEDEKEGAMQQGNDEEEKDDNATTTKEEESDTQPPPQKKLKKARSKPVPADYVCQACQNKHAPLHWIYDCPDKKTVKGTNRIKKKLRGLHDPDSKKVFVTGLPFDTKNQDVQGYFASCGKVAQCKLITFPDTGRCKGSAIVVFETDEEAKKAYKMSGTIIENDDDKKKKKKKKGSSTSSAETKRPELKLKVTKVLNRSQTKRKSSHR